MIPSYGGLLLFGQSVRFNMVINPNAAQIAAFFGVQGVQSLDGGQRGRVFEVEGLMVGATNAFVEAAAAQLEQFANGPGRILIDTAGIVWPNVVYRNEFAWAMNKFLYIPAQNAKARAYKLVLHGLT